MIVRNLWSAKFATNYLNPLNQKREVLFHYLYPDRWITNLSYFLNKSDENIYTYHLNQLVRSYSSATTHPKSSALSLMVVRTPTLNFHRLNRPSIYLLKVKRYSSYKLGLSFSRNAFHPTYWYSGIITYNCFPVLILRIILFLAKSIRVMRSQLSYLNSSLGFRFSSIQTNIIWIIITYVDGTKKQAIGINTYERICSLQSNLNEDQVLSR